MSVRSVVIWGSPLLLSLSRSMSPLTMANPPGHNDIMKRMSLRRFGKIVARVMHSLPDEFRPFLDNVVVDVEEEPDRKTLLKAGFTEEEITAGDSLLGLFDPLDLP